jgi:hypothetical protein
LPRNLRQISASRLLPSIIATMLRMIPMRSTLGLLCRIGSVTLLLALPGRAAEAGRDVMQVLLEQNRVLQAQVRTQQKTIDELTAQTGELLKASARHERELRDLQEGVRGDRGRAGAPVAANRQREVRIAGEAGLAFFKTGRDGQFPKDEFRADDPVISVEAPVLKDVYFFAEMKLLTRETNVENFQLGEIYADFESVSAAWGAPGLLGVRVGRINIPFGEEYLVRGPVANPLISHSLSDIWGVDEGLEAYGRLGALHYVFAVQNGGVSRLRDHNADKSLTARVGWEARPWLHLSGSAMRTGELASIADNLSEVWFANGFFRAIGPVARTGRFQAALWQADARTQWKGGSLLASLGRADYKDSDPVVDNTRRMRFGHVELVQNLGNRLYGAARYSEIRAPRGYPLAGWGNMGRYFFSPLLTERLRRLSVGVGYRFGDPLVVKFEYAWETGRTVTGLARGNEDFLGGEVGMRF